MVYYGCEVQNTRDYHFVLPAPGYPSFEIEMFESVWCILQQQQQQQKAVLFSKSFVVFREKLSKLEECLLHMKSTFSSSFSSLDSSVNDNYMLKRQS